MKDVEANLELARRHVAEGEQRIADLLARIAQLEAHGHNTAHAEALLSTYEGALATMHTHVDQLEAAAARQRLRIASVNVELGTSVGEVGAPLDALIDEAPVSIVLFDPQLRFVHVNAHAASVSGLPAAEHIGKTVRELFPDAADKIEAILRSVRDSGATVRDAEFSRRDPADRSRMRHWLANYYPVRAAEGTLVGIAAVAVEVTEMREAQQALRDADRRKDEFLAFLGHELRNPLGAIRNAVAILQARGATQRDLETARDIIDRQVTHAAHLVDDLLDITRIASGKLPLNKARIAVGETVAGAVEAVRPLLESAGHELTVALAPEPLYVEADRTRLLQVVQNLLTNAARYTPGGAYCPHRPPAAW